MVRSVSWKIFPGIFGKIHEIDSARNAISETPYDFPAGPAPARPFHIMRRKGVVHESMGNITCRYMRRDASVGNPMVCRRDVWWVGRNGGIIIITLSTMAHTEGCAATDEPWPFAVM